MKKFEVSHTNASGVFPNTIAIDASGPSTTDGTEYIAAGINEWWGATQALLDEAGVAPSGVTEVVGTSDILDAQKSLFWTDNLIGGLVSSNNGTDSDHDIDISVGKCMDSTNTYLFKLTSGLIKQIDASWAAGTNAGGLFTGAVAVDTHYGVFLIRKDSDGSIDAGFDTSPVAANIPGGYTAFRRIGWVITDSAANILQFTPTEIAGGAVDVEYKSTVTEISSEAAVTTRQTKAVSVPQLCVGRFAMFLDYVGATTYTWFASVNFTDAAATVNNSLMTADAGSDKASVVTSINVDASYLIAYRSNTAGGANLFLHTKGYTDNRL